MALPEAWPVAISRGDFTAAAGWFCFSFDCFSLDCATATSDKHANPNTRILLFIFSLLCAGNGRHWLSRSERQTSYPHSDSEMLVACAGPRKLPRYWLAVWCGRPRPRKFHRCSRERLRSCALGRARLSVLKQRRRALRARIAAVTVARSGVRERGFMPTWPKSRGLNYVTRPQGQRRLLNSAALWRMAQ